MEELALEGIDRDRLDYEVVAIEGNGKVEVMLRLKAPRSPGEDTGPFHIQVVLDTSEVMHPRKLFPALRGIDYLASELREDDRIGIVTFGGQVEVALPGGPVGDGEAVRETLRQVRPFGVADPAAGLLEGLKEAKKSAVAGHGAIYLITDRAVFRGEKAVVDQVAGVAAAAKEAGFPVTVIPMDGQGSGYLSGIAREGGGRMAGTTDGSRACEVMLEKVPGRRRERVRGVELVIEPCENVRSIEVKGEEPVEAREDGLLCRVGDLRDGETRDILIELEVDDLEELQDDHVAGLNIKWSDMGLEKAFWASMPVKVNGYPADPRPRVRELFNTDPEEGVLFEFPSVEVKLRYPGKPTPGPGEDEQERGERPRPPRAAQDRMREAREKRKLVEKMAEGDLPPEMEARITELACEQASREVARLMEEIREQVPAQLLNELKAKVEEEFRDLGEDEDDEDGGAGVTE